MTLFRGYDRDALDREYDNAKKVPTEVLLGYRQRWKSQSERARSTLSCHLDIPYQRNGKETLDIFVPATKNAPVQIYIHGGYWHSNDKSDCSYIALGFVAQGCVCVIINYTLVPSAGIEDQVKQCAEAVRWLKNNIGKFGGDPDNIHVTGHSAGGHLAAMLLAKSTLVPDAEQLAIKSVSSLSGIYDLEPIRLCFLNETLKLTTQDVARLSPIQYAPASTDSRLLLVTGSLEGDEYERQIVDLAESWQPHLPHIETKLADGFDHFTIRGGLDHAENQILRLVLRHMKPGVSVSSKV
jgi:arylformamidase